MKMVNLAYDLVIPADAGYIIKTLNSHGYEAFLVGGCVRDTVLGLSPQDWDIATNAKPLEIKGLFDKTVDTGIQHGTVTVVLGTAGYEVTTYRVEGEYVDNRCPSEVSFTGSLEADLCRRDFTINALAYHPAKGLVDLFNGLNDIRKKIIRTVGKPDERFQEDALRMLRAVRFAAQLGFVIEALTLQSIRTNGRLLKNISRERIRDEITKLLLSSHPGRFALINDLGLFSCVFPCLEACLISFEAGYPNSGSFLKHTLKAVSQVRPDNALRWAALLQGILNESRGRFSDSSVMSQRTVPLTQKVLDDLRFDKRIIDRVCRLIKNSTVNIRPDYISVRKAVYAIGDDIFRDLLELMTAAVKSGIQEARKEKLENLNRVKRVYREIKRKRHCLNIKDLAVKGHDIIKLGYTPGKEIGNVLARLMEEVLENPGLNSRQVLLEHARDWLAR